MDPKTVQSIIITIVAALMLITFFGLLVYIARVNKKERREKNESPAETIEEPKTEFIPARVISKRISRRNIGNLKTPKSVMVYWVTFLTDENISIEFPVSEEFFEKVSENLEGTLVTINGNFFDFGEGEDIPEIE